MDDKERKRLKAHVDRVADYLPWVRGDRRHEIAVKMISGEIREEDIKALPKAIIDWPQIKGDRGEVASDEQIKKGVTAFNKYHSLLTGNKVQYKTDHLIEARVNTFTRFDLKGLKYLGLLFEDGKKFRFLLENSPTTIKANTKRRWEHQED